MKSKLTGVILAGGKSKRLGRDKALETFNGEPLILKVISSIETLVDEIILVVNDDKRKNDFSFMKNVTFATDKFSDAGSLGGIYTGLHESNNLNALFLACDMPFISMNILSLLINKIQLNPDIIIPEYNGFKQSTHAIYNKNCLPVIKNQLKRGEYKISKIFKKCNTLLINEHEINQCEKDTKSFYNINYEYELEKAKQMLIND